VVEDRLLELSKGVAGLDPELVEPTPRLPVDVESFRLASRSVEREHELGGQALAVRVLGDQGLELRDHAGMPAELEIRIDPFLECCQAQLLEAPDRGLGKRLVCKFGERRPPPHGKRVTEDGGGPFRILRCQRLSPVRQLALEGDQVDVRRLDREEISRRSGQQRVRRQQLPKPRDVDLDALHRGLRRLFSPQLVDQPIARDNLVWIEQENTEESSLLQASQCNGPSFGLDLQCTEELVLHSSEDR
jgi:hypothetical protein